MTAGSPIEDFALALSHFDHLMGECRSVLEQIVRDAGMSAETRLALASHVLDEEDAGLSRLSETFQAVRVRLPCPSPAGAPLVQFPNPSPVGAPLVRFTHSDPIAQKNEKSPI